jgi:hypothetical protein
MELKGKRVRIHQEERERIYSLISVLEHQEGLASYAEKYQDLDRGSGGPANMGCQLRHKWPG